jgi:uncharacterized membrane protein YoaK (UPF0700 family)
VVRVGGDRDEQDFPPRRAAGRRAAQRAAGRGRLSARTLVPLAWAAGIVDAVSYLRLGSVFTANMTGNTVLLGIAVAEGDGGHAARSAAALGGFCAGVVLATLLPGTSSGLLAEGLLLIALAILGHVGAIPRVPLILLGGATMGMQTAAVRRSNRTGVNVTYVTGTVTTLLSRAANRLLGREREQDPGDRDVGLPGSVWLAYGVGGLAGVWHSSTFALSAGAVLLAAALTRVSRPPDPR